MTDSFTQFENAQAMLDDAKRHLADLYAHDRPTLQQRRRVSELGAEVQRLRAQHVRLRDLQAA